MSLPALPPAPKRVRIGARSYRISAVDRMPAGYEETYGLCQHSPAVIYLLAGLEPCHLAEIFHHEVGHAISYEALLVDGGTEENFVALSAKAWIRFFQDNPAATAWMLALARRAR